MPVAVAAGTFDGEVGAPLPPKLGVSFSETTLRCGLKPSPDWVMGIWSAAVSKQGLNLYCADPNVFRTVVPVDCLDMHREFERRMLARQQRGRQMAQCAVQAEQAA